MAKGIKAHNVHGVTCDGEHHTAAQEGSRWHCPGPLTDQQRRAQGQLFGERLKEKELDKHEFNHASDLEAARMIRDRIALERVHVDSDLIREVFEKHRGLMAWGPWAGALFRGRDENGVSLYVAVGFKKSTYAPNHAAIIRIWRRRTQAEAAAAAAGLAKP